jgi:uncharacterized membrane protein YhhN
MPTFLRQTRSPWILAAAIIAGGSYFFAWWYDVVGTAPLIAWKGAGVTLLALWAFVNAKGRDGWLIVGFLAFGALGDVLIDAIGLSAGGLTFLISHMFGIALYFLNRAKPLWLALPAIILVPLVSYLLPSDSGAAIGVALYALGLAAMTGGALISRFPPIVGVGAMMFVVSDWLIFARLGPLATSIIPDLLVWPLYFAGQVLIAVGVVGALAARSGLGGAYGDALHHRL